MNGTVTKRPKKDGTNSWGFYLVVGRNEDGTRIQNTKSGFDTKREAQDALRTAIIEFEAKRDALPVVEVPTFAAFFDRWMREHAARKCAPKTFERYGELGAYAARMTVEIAGKHCTFGDVAIDKVGPMQMELMINALLDHGGQKTKDHPEGKPLSPKSVHNIACIVHGAFEKAVKWQLIVRNPLTGVDLPKLAKKEPSTIEKGAIGKLLQQARGTKIYPLILLGLATGMRRGEMLALTWQDVDFKSGLLSVTKSLEQTKAGGLRVKSTKSEKPRRFAVPAAALAALSEHRVEQDEDRELLGADYEENDLVFCNPTGGYYSPNCAGIRVKKLMQRVGITGLSLHSLRHSHASELISAGVPITTVAKRLGHANANITLAIYAHALEADELAAAKIWDDAMVAVIDANKREPARSLAKSSAAAPSKLQVVEKIAS